MGGGEKQNMMMTLENRHDLVDLVALVLAYACVDENKLAKANKRYQMSIHSAIQTMLRISCSFSLM